MGYIVLGCVGVILAAAWEQLGRFVQVWLDRNKCRCHCEIPEGGVVVHMRGDPDGVATIERWMQRMRERRRFDEVVRESYMGGEQR